MIEVAWDFHDCGATTPALEHLPGVLHEREINFNLLQVIFYCEVFVIAS